MAFTRIQIISNAVTLIGKGVINQTTSIGPIGPAAEQAYDLLYPSLLSSDSWRFNVRLQQLSRLVSTPIIDDWKYVFQLPSDYLALIRLYPLTNYNIYEDKVFSNNIDLTAEYRFLTPEHLLPPTFVEYFVYAIADYLSLGVALQESYAEKMEKRKELAYRRALATDGYSHPNQPIVDAPFIDVRFGSGYNRG